MRVVIIGAGVGGLSAAINLQAIGADVQIYERAPTVADIGAGLVLSPNAGRILRDMGLFDRVRSIACPPGAYVALRWKDGATIVRDQFDTEPGRLGVPTIGVHRGQLVKILSNALPPDIIHLDHQFTGLRQDTAGVTAHFANGETAQADLLIGADGIKSAVARAIDVPTIPRSSGYAAYRGLVPAATIADLGMEPALYTTFGPNSHFVQYFISGGKYLNIVGVVPSEDREESWSREGDIGEAQASFRGWHPQVTEVLARMDSVSLWGLYDRPVRDAWGSGRVGLLGDAVHPMLPFFAQGAAQAVEDSAALATLLRSATRSDIPEVWTRYTRLRLDRVRKIQDIAKENAVTFQLPDGPDQRSRDAALASADDGGPFRNNEWLYGYDAAAAAEQETRAGRDTV